MDLNNTNKDNSLLKRRILIIQKDPAQLFIYYTQALNEYQRSSSIKSL